jgi:hypothetical protein
MTGMERGEAGREQMAREQLRTGDAHQSLQSSVVPGHSALDGQRLRFDPLNVGTDALAGQCQHIAIRDALQ